MPSANKEELALWEWAKRQTTAQAAAHPRDIITLECLANDARYAKPDIEKRFLMVEVPAGTAGIKIVEGVDIDKHPALKAFFYPGDVVRFPVNVADALEGLTLSYLDFMHVPKVPQESLKFGAIPRWSTASRSCFALIPLDRKSYTGGQDDTLLKEMKENDGVDRQRVKMKGQDTFHVGEWTKLKEDITTDANHGRFFSVVRRISDAVTTGVARDGGNFRLYSVKTGVKYIGSVNEPTKGRLEANSAMAMLRSNLMNTLPRGDESLGIQTEVLTITAKAIDMEGTGKNPLDGFQVRELSCLSAGNTYLPGQAIPYVRDEYDGGKNDYWRNTFTVPLGRAKARLFLGYGLIHTSANAQNFVLGIDGTDLRQFIIRDVGDTSWHDNYIAKYAKETDILSAFDTETRSEHRHVLNETSSKDYPPPHIVRLAAWSLLTHGFAEKMGWTEEKAQYAFVTGLLDGFAAFVAESFGVENLAELSSKVTTKPKDVSVDDDVSALGSNCIYPYPGSVKKETYENAIDECLKERGLALLARASAVRKAGVASVEGKGKKYDLKKLVATEETLLCCALERLLFKDQPMSQMEHYYKTIRERIRKGDWPSVVE